MLTMLCLTWYAPVQMITQSRCQWQCIWLIPFLKAASLDIKVVICLSSTFQPPLRQSAIYLRSYWEHAACLWMLTVYSEHPFTTDIQTSVTVAARVRLRKGNFSFFCPIVLDRFLNHLPNTTWIQRFSWATHHKPASQGILLWLDVTFIQSPRWKKLLHYALRREIRDIICWAIPLSQQQ